ncbi:hypothetical protein BGZ61DRAFT_451114 [Ilyonectria robusta]|nr:uncharacterized protein BGZ61DRAFT_451114 [Ilyonectria robusta]KAH8699675.1 hypothetical protein BGZ61DRAFT_451114 [Ilyonectria robusta]
MSLRRSYPQYPQTTALQELNRPPGTDCLVASSKETGWGENARRRIFLEE